MRKSIVALAVIGGILSACLLGWAIAHPMMVLHKVAHEVAPVEICTTSINNDMVFTIPIGTDWDYDISRGPITLMLSEYLWFDDIAFAAGLRPENGEWDLQAVMEALADK